MRVLIHVNVEIWPIQFQDNGKTSFAENNHLQLQVYLRKTMTHVYHSQSRLQQLKCQREDYNEPDKVSYLEVFMFLKFMFVLKEFQHNIGIFLDKKLL